MISLQVALSLCFLHWVADFVFQTDWMAQNKSKSNYPLLVHVSVYSALFIPFAVIAFNNALSVIVFILVNLLAHFATDYLTSRRSSRLYREGKIGSSTVPNFNFFSTIGFDQFLHYLALFTSYVLITTHLS